MDRTRIFIADDHAFLRTGLRMLLGEQEGFEVVGEAGDAEQTIASVETLTPDVLLLDIGLPDQSGLDAIGQIKAISPDTRVLILTMHEDAAYVRSALAAGADGYLVKRAADTELVDAIRKIAGGGQIHPVIEERAPVAPDDDRPPVALLSKREREVLEYIAHGHTNREIGELLGLSVKTVETYRARVGEKLGLKGRAEFVRYALDAGLIARDDAT